MTASYVDAGLNVPAFIRLRQAGAVPEEANETVVLVSIKPRRTDGTPNPSPTARQFWVSHMYLYIPVSLASRRWCLENKTPLAISTPGRDCRPPPKTRGIPAAPYVRPRSNMALTNLSTRYHIDICRTLARDQ